MSQKTLCGDLNAGSQLNISVTLRRSANGYGE